MKQQLLYFVGAIVFVLAIMIFAGCEEAAPEAESVSVADVETVDLAQSVGIGDLTGSTTANTMSASITNSDILDELDAIFSTIDDALSDSTWNPDDVGSGATYESAPENLFELDSLPDSFSITGTLNNAEPIVGMLVDVIGEVNVTLRLRDDGLPSRVIGTGSVSGASAEIPAINGSFSSDTDVLGGFVVAEANAGLDLLPSYTTETDEWGDTDTYPTSFQIAYSVSVEAQAAVSFDNPSTSNAGNFVITLSYTAPPTTLTISETMSDTEIETLIEDSVANHIFSLNVKAYEADGTPVFDRDFTIDDLTAWGTENVAY